MSKPAFQQVHEQLMSILQAGINTELERLEHDPVIPEVVFQPLVSGTPHDETICAAYSGADREPESHSHRDNELIITVNIWAFGVDDRAAQYRAMALEAACIAVLDREENWYLNEACDAPIGIGKSRCLTSDKSPNLMWQLAFPVFCPLRTTRPE